MKKFFALLSASTLLFFFGSINPAAAYDIPPPSLQEQLITVEHEYNLERIDYEVTTADTGEPLEFNTVNEFESFMQNWQTREVNENGAEERTVTGIVEPDYTTKYYHFEWWSPVIYGSIQFWGTYKNIDIKYKYSWVNGHPRFYSIDSYGSYLTGPGAGFGIDWTHRYGEKTYSTKYYPNDTANITVRGTYVLGVVIAGYPIGYKWNGTWKRSLTLR